MSVFCPKCGKRTYDEYTCDHCQYEIKQKDYAQKKNQITNKETITLNKHTILVIAVVVIAISVAYLGINKYKEKQAENKALEMLFGTSDPDEIIDRTKKNIQDAKNIMSNPINMKIPKIKVSESAYEKERRRQKELKRAEERRSQMRIYKQKQNEQKAKEELKRQMSF